MNMNTKQTMILGKSDIYKPEVCIIRSNEDNELIKKLKNEIKLKDDKIFSLQKISNKEKILIHKKTELIQKNNIYFNVIFKILHKILNYNNVKEYSLYGSFIENLLSGKKLEDTTINVFIKDHENMELYSGLLEILYQEDYILNINDFDNICYYSLGEKNIPFLNLEIKLNYQKKIILRIHGYDYMRDISSSARNLEINESGINNIFRMERELMDSNISGLNILKNLKNTMCSETKMYKKCNINKNLVENKDELFEMLSYQNDHILNKWSIIGDRFNYIKDDCSICLDRKIVYELKCHHFFCIDCLHSHINNDSSVNKNCPLCRREILLN